MPRDSGPPNVPPSSILDATGAKLAHTPPVVPSFSTLPPELTASSLSHESTCQSMRYARPLGTYISAAAPIWERGVGKTALFSRFLGKHKHLNSHGRWSRSNLIVAGRICYLAAIPTVPGVAPVPDTPPSSTSSLQIPLARSQLSRPGTTRDFTHSVFSSRSRLISMRQWLSDQPLGRWASTYPSLPSSHLSISDALSHHPQLYMAPKHTPCHTIYMIHGRTSR
jgi:hypothetical protein